VVDSNIRNPIWEPRLRMFELQTTSKEKNPKRDGMQRCTFGLGTIRVAVRLDGAPGADIPPSRRKHSVCNGGSDVRPLGAGTVFTAAIEWPRKAAAQEDERDCSGTVLLVARAHPHPKAQTAASASNRCPGFRW